MCAHILWLYVSPRDGDAFTVAPQKPGRSFRSPPPPRLRSWKPVLAQCSSAVIWSETLTGAGRPPARPARHLEVGLADEPVLGGARREGFTFTSPHTEPPLPRLPAAAGKADRRQPGAGRWCGRDPVRAGRGGAPDERGLPTRSGARGIPADSSSFRFLPSQSQILPGRHRPLILTAASAGTGLQQGPRRQAPRASLSSGLWQMSGWDQSGHFHPEEGLGQRRKAGATKHALFARRPRPRPGPAVPGPGASLCQQRPLVISDAEQENARGPRPTWRVQPPSAGPPII